MNGSSSVTTGRAGAGLLLLSLGLWSCTMQAAPYTVSRFALDFGCVQRNVDVDDLGDDRYRTSGCGQTAVYVARCGSGYCNVTRETPPPKAQATAPAAKTPAASTPVDAGVPAAEHTATARDAATETVSEAAESRATDAAASTPATSSQTPAPDR